MGRWARSDYSAWWILKAKDCGERLEMRIVSAFSLTRERKLGMLKRIKSIQNVGRFRACAPARIEFGPITFVYGLNTYGKSTLGDIFSSLRSSDTSSIKARRTIPSDSTPQTIELSFAAEGQTETTVRYANGEWSKNFPAELSLHVFDDGFYHKNLFSSRQFTRATKEAFSSFVLGEQGVSKTKTITEKNKIKNELARDIAKITSHAFQEISDLPTFLALEILEPIETLEETVASLRTEYDSLRKQRGSIQKISVRKTLATTNWTTDFSHEFRAINTTLKESMKAHQEAARKAVADHIATTFQGERGAEAWIRQGLYYRKGDDCLFCGQHLSLDAMDLINIYEESFDTSFETNSKRINDALEASFIAINKPRITQLSSLITRNKEPLASYPELDDSEYFSTTVKFLESVEADIVDAIKEWDLHWPEFIQSLAIAVERKKETPNLPCPPADDFGLIQIEQNLTMLCSNYDSFVEYANSAIEQFKATVNIADLERKMTEIADQGKSIKTKISRIQLAPQCVEYVSMSARHKELADEIPALNLELIAEQSDFLSHYYKKINEYFKKFGSEDFDLVKGEDNRGHTPIFYLKVKYRDQDISERNLEQVFSESDRRALALSVFWAGVMGSEFGRLKNSIVVLDDPITSFDSNRMTSAHMEIVELSKSVRQILILSHFESGVAAFLNVYRNQLPIKLISITKTERSSDLTLPDVEIFISTEHEKRRAKIFDFISGETDIHSPGDLRVFFELELSLRFAQQIAKHEITEINLSDRIDRLHDNKIISSTVLNTAHQFRLVLNPTHHIWQSNNIEDQRNTARNLIAFIYAEFMPGA
ncbi:AAA family ATPase [Pseudomonas caricapapayae]|uniref:AAA family ATPase n=1 Tax=Pseudomonas caricapapayae TaxID=46678 RepID=UPI001F2D43EE|nr:AAA family ATPase [Pseudomonas caricapapayae]